MYKEFKGQIWFYIDYHEFLFYLNGPSLNCYASCCFSISSVCVSKGNNYSIFI